MPSSACSADRSHLHSFPTRRSSDLPAFDLGGLRATLEEDADLVDELIELFLSSSPSLLSEIESAVVSRDSRTLERAAHGLKGAVRQDRKSTRLNSSHRCSSYAVFCLLCRPLPSPLFPYTTLFRSACLRSGRTAGNARRRRRSRGRVD